MVKNQRRSLLAAGLTVILGWALLQLRSQAPSPAAPGEAGTGPQGAAAKEQLPRIGLDRLTVPDSERPLGKRDIFTFGQPTGRGRSGSPGDSNAGLPTPPPMPVEPAAPPPTVPAAPPRPPINLKYVGLVESQRGLKVAVFVTDRNEVLTGQAGDVVAHRYKVVKIGLESVDMQELGSDRLQRIPFIKVK